MDAMLGRIRVERQQFTYVVVTGGPCITWRRPQPKVGLSYRELSLLVENAYDALSFRSTTFLNLTSCLPFRCTRR